MSTGSPVHYTFGSFEFFPSKGELWEGETLLHLPPKSLRLLSILVENWGKVVERDELMQILWPRFAERANLDVQIRNLRSILKDARISISRSEYKYISTIPGKGYRFNEPVQVYDNVGQIHFDQSEVPEALTNLKSIAVLPFTSLIRKSDKQLRFSLADELIHRLSNLKTVAVRPTSAIVKYLDVLTDPIAAGVQLNVNAVLHGYYQSSNDQTRVTVQLSSVPDGFVLWAHSFSDSRISTLDISVSIADQLVKILRVKLTGGERKRILKQYTQNPEAERLYKAGRLRWMRRTKEAVQESIIYFDSAINEDPDFALAYVGLADACITLGIFGTAVLPTTDVMPKANEALQRALDIDPLIPEAHASLASITFLYEWDWALAEKEFKMAIRLNPNYATAHQWYSRFQTWMGRIPEALESIKRAHKLAPLAPLIETTVGWTLHDARQQEKAIAWCEKTIKTFPNFGPAFAIMGLSYEQLGEIPKAISAFKLAIEKGDVPVSLAFLGHAYALAGHNAKAYKVISKLKEMSEEKDFSKRYYVNPYLLAIIHIGLGKKEIAFEWLNRAYHERSEWMPYLGVDPRIDPLRSDKRFEIILQRLKLKSIDI